MNSRQWPFRNGKYSESRFNDFCFDAFRLKNTILTVLVLKYATWRTELVVYFFNSLKLFRAVFQQCFLYILIFNTVKTSDIHIVKISL